MRKKFERKKMRNTHKHMYANFKLVTDDAGRYGLV